MTPVKSNKNETSESSDLEDFDSPNIVKIGRILSSSDDQSAAVFSAEKNCSDFNLAKVCHTKNCGLEHRYPGSTYVIEVDINNPEGGADNAMITLYSEEGEELSIYYGVEASVRDRAKISSSVINHDYAHDHEKCLVWRIGDPPNDFLETSKSLLNYLFFSHENSLPSQGKHSLSYLMKLTEKAIENAKRSVAPDASRKNDSESGFRRGQG